MLRRLRISLPALLVLAALLAGCGSSSSSSGSSAATSSTPASSQTGSTATSTSSKAPGSADAVAACKRGIQSLPHLQQKVTEKLEAICEKASGDANAQRKAAEEACRELVNASPLPAGEAKDRALAACKNAGGSK